MHIISFRKLREFFEQEPDAKVALQDWFKRTKKAEWDNFSEMKQTFNSVDAVGNSRFVFNIKGNHYRIIVKVMFTVKRVYIRWIGRHLDYDKIKDIKNIKDMKNIIAHEDYVKANLVVESLINKVDDDMNKNHELITKLLEASDIVESYEEIQYPIGLPSLVDVIRLRMAEMRLKNKDLAKLLNTTPSRISEYLNGKRDITLKVARGLQRKLNIDSDIILNG